MQAGMTRFRSTDEEEDDAVIQMAYSRTRTRKNKGLVYLICVVLGLALGVVLPFGLGATSNPFLYPIWPLLFMPLLFGIIGLVIGLIMNYKVVNSSANEIERATEIKRCSNGALLVLVLGLVFTIFFVSIAVSPWLTDIVDRDYGTYTKPVMGRQTQDFEFTPDDPLYIVHGSLDVQAMNSTIKCNFFVGNMGVFEKINDTQNINAVQNASLPHAYKYNVNKFIYDGTDFKPGKSYIVRVYNFNSDDDINVHIKIHREVDGSLLWGLLVLCVCYVAIGGVGFGLMQALRVSKARPTAPPAQARPAPQREAATMFADMEQEVQTMFPARPAGPQPQRPPGRPYGQMRPAPPRPGVAGARPGAPAREIAVERPVPQGVQKTIACPRCRTKFSYTKIEGRVTEIQCPKCGKKGRVGARTAPPTPAPAEELIPGPAPTVAARLPPARPVAPPRPTRPPAAAKPAVSPLDDVLGTTAPATPRPAGAKTKTIACPKCKQRFTVVEKPRPFDIKCPNCGKTGTLR